MALRSGAGTTNMGIALPALVTDKKEQGEVLSAFFDGYMCTQVMLSIDSVMHKRAVFSCVLTVLVDPRRVFCC